MQTVGQRNDFTAAILIRRISVTKTAKVRLRFAFLNIRTNYWICRDGSRINGFVAKHRTINQLRGSI
jgi:hypothetical protein